MTGVQAAALVATALVLSSCGAPAARLGGGHFDARCAIHADGDADIDETIALSWPAGRTTFERRVAIDRADQFTFLSAKLDGRDVPRGGAGDVGLSVADGRVLDVRWIAPADGAVAHTFELRYHATRAVEIHGTEGTLRLRLLDATRGFDVDEATIHLDAPPGMALADASGVAEGGWTVRRTAEGMVAERRGLAPTDSATVAAMLPIDPSHMTDPAWQINEERTAQFSLAFLSGGVFILVVGVGVVWIVRFEHPRTRAGDDEERRIVRRGLWRGGLSCIGLAGPTALAMWPMLTPFGLWPLAVPISILVVGLMLVGVSGWIV